MSSKLTRNFATKEELNQAGIIDADLFEDTLASLPTTAPLSVDGVSVVTGTKVLFGQLNRIYQATVSGATVSWEDISGSDLSDTQKVLIDQGTVYNNDIIQNQSGTWNIANDGKAGGGGGEINTASNVGGQVPVFKQKTGVDLEFRSLQGSGATTVTQTGDTITISSTDTNTGEVNTNSNAGATGAGLVKTKVGVNTPIKRLTAGANVSLTENTDDIQISASGEANTNSNAGSTGATLVKAKSGVDTPIKRLKAGSNITLTENADDIEIAAAGGGGGASPRNFVFGSTRTETNLPPNVWSSLMQVTITPQNTGSIILVRIMPRALKGVVTTAPYRRSNTSGIYLDNVVAGTPALAESWIEDQVVPTSNKSYLSHFSALTAWYIHDLQWYIGGVGAGGFVVLAGVPLTLKWGFDATALSGGFSLLNLQMYAEEIF